MKFKIKNSFFYRALIVLAVLVVVSSCSRKKTKWVNRNFHAMGTYYNILYHGNLALEEGKTQLNENFADDYWEVLPVERLTDTDDPVVYGQMVEVPPAVMPQRPKPKKKEDSSDKKDTQRERTLDDAFSAFDNTGSNLNSGRNQMNQGGRDQSGMNQGGMNQGGMNRSEEHTSELQSRGHLVCRL